jgi:cobalt-zinc-cadmium resistance protein CzcA
MSMIGQGADDVFYTSSKRFTSVQFGLDIPLFRKAQKAHIDAAKVNVSLVNNQQNEALKALQMQYQNALLRFKNAALNLDYFESKALKNAILISKTAQTMYEKGEIHFLDWFLLQQQSYSLQNDYNEALLEYNNSIILLQFLNSQN